jgi:hypothetical protein
LIKQIIASLTESLELLEKAARASHEEAIHESSRAESKYDTGRLALRRVDPAGLYLRIEHS